jgi:bifunctional non-homologous end joining protein LigD
VVTVSSPDRVVYPDSNTTKAEVVGHYSAVGERMLPHLAGRPLTLERYPKGIAAAGFMQKNASGYFPDFIGRYQVPRADGITTHPVVYDVAGIEYLANQNTITFHVPSATSDDFEHPDRLIIDLDPPEDSGSSARESAWATKALLDELGLESVPVATGSKGFHITAATDRNITVQEASEFGQLAAALLSQRHPDLLTIQFRKANRAGRVFCDWLRNRRGATTVVPWSLRARRRPSVAVPITWNEIAEVAPAGFELGDLPAADPLQELLAAPSDIQAALNQIRQLAAEANIEVEPFDRFRS